MQVGSNLLKIFMQQVSINIITACTKITLASLDLTRNNIAVKYRTVTFSDTLWTLFS